MLGRSSRVLKSGTHDEAHYADLWQTITSGRVWRGQLTNRKKDGSLYTEAATISPVLDASGQLAGFVAVKRDVTAQLQLEAQLLAANKMEAIGRLAGGVAHDFNNLISVILGCTAFAVETLPEGAPALGDLLEVTRAGERAAALTRQLLAFGRKQVLDPVPLDVNRLASELEKMLERIIGEDIDLTLKLAPDLGVIRADKSQLEQVIMNLVVNARDAMPTGGTLTIETSTRQVPAHGAVAPVGLAPGSYVRIAVTDTGTGMDRQTRERLFEPFFTTKAQGKGTGLGLSTAYGIVKQSGGEIAVESELNRGSTFEVYLPRIVAEAAPKPAARKPAARPASLETILVLEDEPALLKIAKRSLEAAGYTVLTAGSGAEALRVSADHRGEIHLLLTDVVLRGPPGTEIARALLQARPSLRVLLMSGYTDDAIVHRGALREGTHFLGKPFSSAELTKKVREVLEGWGPALSRDGS